MELPKFLLADNSSLQNVIFVIHTEYPRFIMNITNDEVHWLEDFDKKDIRCGEKALKNSGNFSFVQGAICRNNKILAIKNYFCFSMA